MLFLFTAMFVVYYFIIMFVMFCCLGGLCGLGGVGLLFSWEEVMGGSKKSESPLPHLPHPILTCLVL